MKSKQKPAMGGKRKFLFALIGIVILIVLVILFLPAQLDTTNTTQKLLLPAPLDTNNTTQNSADSIILKIPVTQLNNPNNTLSGHKITTYTDSAIALGEEFNIDPKNIDSGNCAPKITFRLDGISNDSLSLSITAVQAMNGEIYSQSNPEKHLISDGNCIAVGPLCTDIGVSYCFEIKKSTGGNIQLYYSIKMEGIMPYPTN